MDMDMLKKGEKYINLKKSLVIFICTFDPFGLGLPVYSFEHRCVENLSLQLGDGIGTIMLNSEKWRHMVRTLYDEI